MATYFTRGVESTNELRISLSRLNAFLTLPEPPVPSHLKVLRSSSPNLSCCLVESLFNDTYSAQGCCRVLQGDEGSDSKAHADVDGRAHVQTSPSVSLARYAAASACI